jgi:hypothetical protein
MINGKKDAPILFAGCAKVDRGFSAIAPDFKARPLLTGFKGGFIKPDALFPVQKPFYCVYKVDVG